MKVLIIGSGGREHAIAWKVAQSNLVSKIFAAPGNPGIGKVAECVNINPMDLDSLIDFAKSKSVDMTIVGPEAPLVTGITDRFEAEGLKVFGPSKAAARLEGSKSFAKFMMKKYGVPTADFQVFDDPAEAIRFVKRHGVPIVVKADGLAAGKGVVVASTVEEAIDAIDRIMVKKAFGNSGERIVIEDCLRGEEASYLVVSDGRNFVPLASSQDHKRIFDGDRGPNTGGMGAYSPAPILSKSLEEKVKERIIEPILTGMRREGSPFKGVLYAGLMISGSDVNVLEFNVRFGDPETEAILRRMNTDIVEVARSTVDGNLIKRIDWIPQTSICVVLSSKGYPGKYEVGKVITGIEKAEGMDSTVVFQAGTAVKNGNLVTNGGRVLDVTSIGNDIVSARENVYSAIKLIHFDGMHYRTDIGLKALKF